MWIECPDCGGMFKVSFLWQFFAFVGVNAVFFGAVALIIKIVQFFKE